MYYKLLKILGGYLAILWLTTFILPSSLNQVQQIGITYSVVFISILLLVRNLSITYSIRFNNRPKNLVVVGLLILILAVISIYSLNGTDISHSKFSIILILYVAFIQTLCEEIIFRGILINMFLSLKHKLIIAIIFSSVTFGLFHFLSLFKTNDTFSVINQVIIATMVGYFFGCLFIYSKNILIVGVIHMLLNLPAYFKRISNPSSEELEVLVDTPILESIFSTIMIIALYSPLVIIGYFLFNRATKKSQISKPSKIFKYPFLDFSKIKI